MATIQEIISEAVMNIDHTSLTTEIQTLEELLDAISLDELKDELEALINTISDLELELKEARKED